MGRAVHWTARPICFSLPLPARGWSPTGRGGRLECIAQAALDSPLEDGAVEHEPDGPPSDDRVALRLQELPCERERIANAEAQHGVEVPREREVQQGRMRDAARHASSCGGDSGDIVLGEDVVSPLGRGVDGK